MTGGLEIALMKIKETAKSVYDRGWGEATSGNMSICLRDSVQTLNHESQILNSVYPFLAGKTIVITSSGSRMRHISAGRPENYCSVITLNDEGSSYFMTGKKENTPSSELSAHLKLHNYFAKERPDINSVLHCHPDQIISLLHLKAFKTREAVDKMLFDIHTEAQLLIPDGVGLVGLKKPGSEELAEAVLKELRNTQIVLIEKHGCISSGRDLDEALDKIEFVNNAIKIYFEIIKFK